MLKIRTNFRNILLKRAFFSRSRHINLSDKFKKFAQNLRENNVRAIEKATMIELR